MQERECERKFKVEDEVIVRQDVCVVMRGKSFTGWLTDSAGWDVRVCEVKQECVRETLSRQEPHFPAESSLVWFELTLLQSAFDGHKPQLSLHEDWKNNLWFISLGPGNL